MCLEGTPHGPHRGLGLSFPGVFSAGTRTWVLRDLGPCPRHLQQLSQLTFLNPSGPAQHSGCTRLLPPGPLLAECSLRALRVPAGCCPLLV